MVLFSGELSCFNISFSSSYAAHNLDFEEKDKFGPASSACLSLRKYIEVMDKRYALVSTVNSEKPWTARAQKLLDERVKPAINQLKQDQANFQMSHILLLKKKIDYPTPIQMQGLPVV